MSIKKLYFICLLFILPFIGESQPLGSYQFKDGLWYLATESISPIPPIPGYLQGTNYSSPTPATPSTTLITHFNANATAGDTIIVQAGAYTGGNGATVSITDSLGNTYTPALPLQSWKSNNSWHRMFYATNITGGSCWVTSTWTASITYPSMYILEYTNIASYNPVDQYSANSGTTAAANEWIRNTAITTVQSYEIAIGYADDNTGPLAVGPNFGTPYSLKLTQMEDLVITNIGQVQGSFTNVASSDPYTVIVVTFKHK